MLVGFIYCFMAFVWLGMAFMLTYTIYACHDIVGWGVSSLLGIVTICALVEFVLLMIIGIARIWGYH